MKKFKDLTGEEQRHLILSSKELRERFENYIQDCEMDYMTEKLDCVSSSLSKYSIGFCEPSFMYVRDYEDFLDGVIQSAKKYGASERMEKLIKQCEKLRGTNLFEFYCKKLKGVFFQDEFKSTIDYVEDTLYELYCNKINENLYDSVDCFFSNLEEYLYDEESQTFYKPIKLSA